jgi:hypothetical protein
MRVTKALRRRLSKAGVRLNARRRLPLAEKRKGAGTEITSVPAPFRLAAVLTAPPGTRYAARQAMPSGRNPAIPGRVAHLQLVDDPLGRRLVHREVGEREDAHRDRVSEDQPGQGRTREDQGRDERPQPD